MALRILPTLLLAVTATFSSAAEVAQEKWDRDAGKLAPRLVASAWLGSPVSLESARRNTVVLAFWNLDVAWC